MAITHDRSWDWHLPGSAYKAISRKVFLPTAATCGLCTGLWSQTVWAQVLSSWVVLDESFNLIKPQFYLLKNRYNNRTNIIELWELNMIICIKQLAWCFKYSEWSLNVISSLYHGMQLDATMTSAKLQMTGIFQEDQHHYAWVPDTNNTKWLFGYFTPAVAANYWATAYLQVVCRCFSWIGAVQWTLRPNYHCAHFTDRETEV